jgi:hypothetical protein
LLYCNADGDVLALISSLVGRKGARRRLTLRTSLMLLAWLMTVDHKIADVRRNIAAKMTRRVEMTNVAVYRQIPLKESGLSFRQRADGIGRT